ncbi:ABC transporter permease [Ignisphaera sp. 4213-co]|uniref:ABC transporter permease n=1 Tax=Ignisphaera cupida TaxID=3050454 RepID=A0ABD4Z5N1_9CREN|nr:ABC transporter permease [Ignisphaera sp. 4213-co]MDK6028475.1 ABC transporter permease [Ignisphaera sp. 4213-co]
MKTMIGFGVLKRFAKGLKNLYMKDIKFRIGFTLFIAIIVVGLLSLFSPPYYKTWYYFKKDLPPSFQSLDLLLGTTTNGRPVFWSLTNAIINSLAIAAVTTLIASHLGLVIGLVSGIRGGVVDRVLMTITDTFVTIPGFPLLFVLSMILKDYLTIPLLGLMISITSWPWPARQVRAIVLSLRERDFVLTARLSGAGTFKIIVQELLPYVLGWHLINATNTVLYSIGSEAGLAILGLSILSEDTLGTMIYWAQHYGALYRGKLWWIMSPVTMLIIIFVSLYLISFSLQEYFNPRLRRLR